MEKFSLFRKVETTPKREPASETGATTTEGLIGYYSSKGFSIARINMVLSQYKEVFNIQGEIPFAEAKTCLERRLGPKPKASQAQINALYDRAY
jgi:hypothetical protein